MPDSENSASGWHLVPMRNLPSIAAMIAVSASSPAAATGGLLCTTAAEPEIKVSIGFGHVPGAPIVAKHLWVDGKKIPVQAPQWWLDDEEMRIELTDTDMMHTLLVMRTKRNGWNYDGQVTWAGKTHWIRCKEN